MKMQVFYLVVWCFIAFWVSQVQGSELSGYIGSEVRIFTENEGSQSSLFVEPEFYTDFNEGADSLVVKVFARVDSLDDERSHGDIRELLWLHAEESWELHLGIGKEFWGVTEALHLVDIINQTDAVETADGEVKLGQPMIKFTSLQTWGVIDAFVLPYFRERTLPGLDGRLGGGIKIAPAYYESNDEQQHTDFAIRYSHTWGSWDIGVAMFEGTNREPKFVPEMSLDGDLILSPFYDQITQQSIDIQGVFDGIIYKLEALNREDSLENYSAVTGGIEFTVVGIGGSFMDLGLLAEFQYDSREVGAIGQNDLFFGTRLVVNDVQDTNLLLGFSQDLDESGSQLAFVEANRRFGEAWRVSVDGRFFRSESMADPLYQIRKDDHLTLTLNYYF